mgnify:CR=1 FL=1
MAVPCIMEKSVAYLYAYLWLSKGHYLPVKKSEVTF